MSIASKIRVRTRLTAPEAPLSNTGADASFTNRSVLFTPWYVPYVNTTGSIDEPFAFTQSACRAPLTIEN